MEYVNRTTKTPEPEPEKPRKSRPLRLSEDEEAIVQRVADRDGLNWSEAARRMLAYAGEMMPEGWHPRKQSRSTRRGR